MKIRVSGWSGWLAGLALLASASAPCAQQLVSVEGTRDEARIRIASCGVDQVQVAEAPGDVVVATVDGVGLLTGVAHQPAPTISRVRVFGIGFGHDPERLHGRGGFAERQLSV